MYDYPVKLPPAKWVCLKLFVCLSVAIRHVDIVLKCLNISSKFIYHSPAPAYSFLEDDLLSQSLDWCKT